MKKFFTLFLAAALLCGTPIHAVSPEALSNGAMPAAWLDPIRVPQSDSVMAVYRYDKIGRTLRRGGGTIAEAVCSALGDLKAGEVVLNVPDISFIPVDRCPGDTVYELRTGDARAMRYYVSGDSIISQRIEEGMMYQGMAFTGGNTPEIAARLNALSGYEYAGEQPFEIPAALSAIELYNYIDLTCTRILSGQVIRRAQDLLALAWNPGETGRISDERFRDIHEVSLVLEDGTDLTMRLYTDGVELPATEESVNVPRDKVYPLDRAVYNELINTLRTHQSACAPAWLYSMDPHRITAMTLTAPDGRERNFTPGGQDFTTLLDTVLGITVEPLGLQKLSRRTYPDDAYAIRIAFNDDRVYTVDYGPDSVQIEASGMDFVAGYTVARGFRDGVRILDGLL